MDNPHTMMCMFKTNNKQNKTKQTKNKKQTKPVKINNHFASQITKFDLQLESRTIKQVITLKKLDFTILPIKQ